MSVICFYQLGYVSYGRLGPHPITFADLSVVDYLSTILEL